MPNLTRAEFRQTASLQLLDKLPAIMAHQILDDTICGKTVYRWLAGGGGRRWDIYRHGTQNEYTGQQRQAGLKESGHAETCQGVFLDQTINGTIRNAVFGRLLKKLQQKLPKPGGWLFPALAVDQLLGRGKAA